MYCSTCGGAVARSLTYCNHCGANLNGPQDEKAVKSSQESTDSLIWGLVAAVTGGLGCIIGLMAVMKEVAHLNDGLIAAFTTLAFMLVTAVVAVLAAQLIRGPKQQRELIEGERFRRSTTKELEPTQARSLPEGMPSVTEHTTRTFEPIHRERNTN